MPVEWHSAALMRSNGVEHIGTLHVAHGHLYYIQLGRLEVGQLDMYLVRTGLGALILGTGSLAVGSITPGFSLTPVGALLLLCGAVATVAGFTMSWRHRAQVMASLTELGEDAGGGLATTSSSDLDEQYGANPGSVELPLSKVASAWAINSNQYMVQSTLGDLYEFTTLRESSQLLLLLKNSS